MALDSFAPGHPGMPQDCSKWTDNDIYSNNDNVFDDERDKYCNDVPFEKRRKEIVCPQFLAVVGTGIMWYGANQNIVREQPDLRQLALRACGCSGCRPHAARRATTRPSSRTPRTATGSSNNTFGVAPDGSSRPNGQDVIWDEQGIGNCWEDNTDRDPASR